MREPRDPEDYPATDQAPRGGRRRRHRESDEMAAFLARMCRAMIRRAGAGDLGALTALVELRRDVDNAITAAGAELYAGGHSYSTLGQELGITRQSARERFTRVGASPDAIHG